MNGRVDKFTSEELLNYTSLDELQPYERYFDQSIKSFGNNGSRTLLNAGILNNLLRAGVVPDNELADYSVNALAFALKTNLSFSYVLGVKNDSGTPLATIDSKAKIIR